MENTQPQIVTKNNDAIQLDNMNFLYEIMKIKCELVFYNKEKNPIFFNQIKNLFTEEINCFNSFNFKEDHKLIF